MKKNINMSKIIQKNQIIYNIINFLFLNYLIFPSIGFLI